MQPSPNALLLIADSRPHAANRRSPLWLWAGLGLVLGFWWVSWFGPAPLSERAIFPLWLGYILAADGLTVWRAGTSLLTRDWRRFGLLFVFSIPLWWLFELANRYLANWTYLLPRSYGAVEYALWASLAFSTVLPAIFTTAELLRTFPPFALRRAWITIAPERRGLLALSCAGLAMFLLSLAVPLYFFPLVWIGLFLMLDPINALRGYPSIAAQVREGRWDTVLVLCAAGLVCGGFWELWNYHAMPKWVYNVPFAGDPRLFEMPLLGYGGYLPFALEVFAVWALLYALLLGHDNDWLRLSRPGGED